MRKERKIFSVAILIASIVVLSSLYYYFSIVNKPLSIDTSIDVTVDEGEGFNAFLEKLDEKGYLRNKLLVKLNVKINNTDTNIIPGTYTLEKDTSLEELIKTLQTEDLSKNQVSVTIPEGYTIDKIALKLQEAGLCTKDEFIQAVKSYKLPSYVKNNPKKKYNLEGYLYPDTYFFHKDATAEDVITQMLDEFIDNFKKAEEETGVKVNESDIENIVIKASLVEKEAVLNEERPLVASVIENRLKKDMKLEFCSTVNYIIGYDHEVLTNSDIKIDSPYNTYKYKGLPVGPIASPSYNSIKACLKPAETNYLYFMLLTGQDGKHHFSTTAEEHMRVQAEEEAKRK